MLKSSQERIKAKFFKWFLTLRSQWDACRALSVAWRGALYTRGNLHCEDRTLATRHAPSTLFTMHFMNSRFFEVFNFLKFFSHYNVSPWKLNQFWKIIFLDRINFCIFYFLFGPNCCSVSKGMNQRLQKSRSLADFRKSITPPNS